MLKNALTILKEARELVSRGWTQGFYARGHYGSPVSVDSNSAICFCALGAVVRIGNDNFNFIRAKDVLTANLVDFDSVISFNDHPDTKFDDVIALFDRAIKAQELISD